MRYPFVTLTGRSGAGKTTVVRALQELGFSEAVSTTTREPRTGETERDYTFVDQETFRSIDYENEFLEVVEFSGNRYGITRNEIYEKTQHAPTLIVVDGHGAEQILDRYESDGPLYRVFLDVSLSTSCDRLNGRGDTPEQVGKRLSHDADLFGAWKQEIDWDLMIYNQDLLQTVHTISAFVRPGE